MGGWKNRCTIVVAIVGRSARRYFWQIVTSADCLGARGRYEPVVDELTGSGHGATTRTKHRTKRGRASAQSTLICLASVFRGLPQGRRGKGKTSKTDLPTNGR